MLRDHGYGKRKGKEEYSYSAFLHQGTHKVLRHGSHSFTCKQHHACLFFMSVHQMAPPQQLRQQTSNCSLLLIYWPWKDERLSWPGWLICSGWFTHLSGHPSATGQAQDSESTPAKDRRSTAGPRNQPGNGASATCGVPVYAVAFTLVTIYIAWWQRHMGVNNLPKVVTQQCRRQESNSQPLSHKSN